MDWEQWLGNASARPSDTEDEKRDRTERQIKEALRAYGPLEGRPYSIYTKGSYANNTNVRLDFDVDIAVEYRGYFYYDLDFELKNTPPADIGIEASTDPYTRDEFKADILAALQQAYGSQAISAGRIAYRVRDAATTLPADVVPCWEYRRYDRPNAGYHEGSCVYPKGGSRTVNYPKLQRQRGNTKNGLTSKRYKRMVRALKKLQARLADSSAIAEPLPSYLIECLVYNVPDDKFGHSSYLSDMWHVLAAIFNSTLENGDWWDWEEVNGLQYLYRGERAWTRQQVHLMANAAWNELGFE